MCYCETLEREIFEDIARMSVPEEALVRSCCWSQICRVRQQHEGHIDPEVWRELCTKRGYLQQRQNPRGF
jgi:hypothetical protein